MSKADVHSLISEVGIVPAVRVPVAEYAVFAAESLDRAGIPIAEIALTVPGAVDVIARLTARLPNMLIGAGTVLDVDSAARSLDAGARFLSSPGLVHEVVEFAHKRGVICFAGGLTPTEVIAAWKAGADFVQIFPCDTVGGAAYIRALKVPLPQVPLIASGGVNQQTASDFIRAGAAAISVGVELMPREALYARRDDQIIELGRRFLSMVRGTRLAEAV